MKKPNLFIYTSVDIESKNWNVKRCELTATPKKRKYPKDWSGFNGSAWVKETVL